MSGMAHGGITRSAPTPSGFLHAGNAINFLLVHRLANEFQARHRLRIDDLDVDRMRSEYLDDIFRSLEWLGITWKDGPRDTADHLAHFSQQARIPRYLQLADQLRACGVLYACSCSRSRIRELAERGSPRCECRSMKLPWEAPDLLWRLHVPEGTVVEVPVLFGAPVPVDLGRCMPDPVLRQRNGEPAYQLATIADDLDHGTTFIVRGADLLPSSACQVYIARLLDLRAFLEITFVHHPLALDEAGNKLSKSAGSASLAALRASGVGPDALHAQAEAMLERLRSA